MRTRTAFIEKISQIAQETHASITSNKETLALTYQPNIQNPETYQDQLASAYDRDLATGTTSAGIHKDDILFTINEIPARNFGSQGQQRTAALSAKLAEIELIKSSTKTTPVLLLDDVLSELDSTRQRYLLTQINDLQTILTCTGLEEVLTKNVNDAKILNIEKGMVSQDRGALGRENQDRGALPHTPQAF